MMSIYRRYLFILILFSFYIYYSSIIFTGRSSTTKSLRVLYLIRTNSQFYDKRLTYLLQTWISLVRDDAFFISDKTLPNISHDHLLLTQKTCGPDTHSMSLLCCKTAHDFQLFHRYFSAYDWFCHFDDDQYVHVDNLREYLAKFDANDPHYIGRNSWSDTLKRSKEPFPHPFWFATLGAGVCLSKESIRLLRPYTTSVAQFVRGCQRENYHDDIYLGFLLAAFLNVSLTKSHRFHSHLERAFYANRTRFLQIFSQQITFGVRRPDRYPYYLPQLYPISADPYRLRTLHCLLYPQMKQCQMQLHQYLFNRTR